MKKLSVKLLFFLLCLIIVIVFSGQAINGESDSPDRPKVALVLGGGAAWGLAHIGVLEVLEENNIEVDIISGTSAGAIVGAFHADGYSSSELKNSISELRWRDFLSPSFNGPGIFNTDRMENHIDSLLETEKIEDLPVPFSVSTTDLDTGEALSFDRGPLVKLISASAAVPIVFDPVEYDEYLLIDGGLVDNLPVQAARDLGADIIIAVDVNNNFSFTNRPEGTIEYGNRAYNILRKGQSRPENIDIYISPDLNNYRGFEFDEYESIIAQGRKSAEDKISEINELLHSKGLID